MEHWKPLDQLPGYLFSSTGRVISLRGRNPRFLKPFKVKNGYLQISAHGKNWNLHRLILRAHKGEPVGDADQSRHLNGIRQDNRIENLQWGTVSENQRDREKHGTSNKGRKRPLKKST